MKWPQFDLWRLFAATGLLGASLACFLRFFDIYYNKLHLVASPGWIMLGMGLAGAALGAPFKKGIEGAFAGGGLFVVGIVVYAIVSDIARA